MRYVRGSGKKGIDLGLAPPPSEERRSELTEFLRDRRARVTPESAGFEANASTLARFCTEHARLGTLRLHYLQLVPTSHPDLSLTPFMPADEATHAALATLADG